MLVLGRSAGQRIVVPGLLEVRVSSVRERRAFFRFRFENPPQSYQRWMKQGDSMELTDGIEIVLVSARRGIASIGMLADKGVKILRGELE